MNVQLVYRYILSLSKNEYMFYEKRKRKNKKQKTKGPPKSKKGVPRRESNPGPPTCKVNTLPIAPLQPTMKPAGRRCLSFILIYQELKDVFEKNKHVSDSRTLTHSVAFEEHMEGGSTPLQAANGMCRWMGSHCHDWID